MAIQAVAARTSTVGSRERPAREIRRGLRSARSEILILDERAVIRHGLAQVVRLALESEASSASDLAEARTMLATQDLSPETIVLLGIRSGADPGPLVAAVRQLGMAVICVLSGENPGLIHAALMTDADGYLLLGLLDAGVLSAAVAGVRAGERVIPPELRVPTQIAQLHCHEVTDRCREVLRLLADGLHDDEIAAALGISVSSVRKHIGSAQQRLDARTRTQAVALAVRRGLL